MEAWKNKISHLFRLFKTCDLYSCQRLFQISKDSRGSVKENLKDLKRDFDLQQLRLLTQGMSPDRLLEVGIMIAQRLPASKRDDFAEFLKQIETSDETSELKFSDGEKSDDNLAPRGLDDSSESGEPWFAIILIENISHCEKLPCNRVFQIIYSDI